VGNSHSYAEYEAPALTVLGSVLELTQSGGLRGWCIPFLNKQLSQETDDVYWFSKFGLGDCPTTAS
jgi:hypothetical protein